MREFTRKPHQPQQNTSSNGPRSSALTAANNRRLDSRPHVQDLIGDPLPVARHGGGQALPTTTAGRMQQALGHDFASVRVHADPAAAIYAERLGARAATVGSDVFFNSGEFRPSTVEGERLIGHELAHVVQQSGGDRRPGGPSDPERAAEAVGNATAYGAIVPFGLRATAARVPALQPKPATQPAPKSWDDRLKDARAEPDMAKRSTAMTALAQEALGATYTVHEAGTTSTASVDPADYATSPTVNFDVRLNQKKKRNSTVLVPADDLGYTFDDTSKKTPVGYPILGPLVLVVGEQLRVKMTADHELFHAAHHAGSTAAKADQEVEAWTDEFTHYFLATYLRREAWAPLIQYYEGVVADKKGALPARVAAVAAISTFYKGLSTAAGTDSSKKSEKERFETWLIRRLLDLGTKDKALMKDLSAALGITAPVRKPAPAPAVP